MSKVSLGINMSLDGFIRRGDLRPFEHLGDQIRLEKVRAKESGTRTDI